MYPPFENSTTRIAILQGCRDEFEECQKWSMNGDCSRNAPFMIFNCRESCGTCGMRSGESKIIIEIHSFPKRCFSFYENKIYRLVCKCFGKRPCFNKMNILQLLFQRTDGLYILTRNAPSFGISVNPIQTKGGSLCPPYLFGRCGISDIQ